MANSGDLSANYLDFGRFGRILGLGDDSRNLGDDASKSGHEVTTTQVFIAVLLFGAVIFSIGLWAANGLRAANAESANKPLAKTREGVPVDYTHA